MRKVILKILRSKKLQPFWGKLNHLSLIGMNYYGGASLHSSGEIPVLTYMKEKLKHKEQVLIFDVGANTGEYSLIANELFKGKVKIHAFEPSLFTNNLLLNRTNEFSDIKVYRIGIGENDSVLKLFSGGDGRTTASVYNFQYRKKDSSEKFTEEIKITSIDSFCQISGITFIDILKIDIEGHELLAIKGAKNLIDSLSVNFIQFEFGKCDIDARVYFRDFYELLSPGFKLYRILSDGLFEIKKYDSSLEIFQTANFLAEKRNLNFEH